MLSIAYGIPLLPEKDPYITLVEDAMYGLFTAVVPGAFLVVRTVTRSWIT